MKTSVNLTLVCSLLFSCKDTGKVLEYLEVTSLTPSPNSVNVDKGTVIGIDLNRRVNVFEGRKIHMRYVNDTSTINYFSGCGLTPLEAEHFCTGPFIWKPGRIVEVTIPQDLSDSEGRRLREPLVYRFSIAADTIPFQLINSLPQTGDTISLGTSAWWYGSLTFSDYLFLRDSVLTIGPSAEIHNAPVAIIDSREIPFKIARFALRNLQPGVTYTLTVPNQITDCEGEALPQDYILVFHTKP